MYPYLCIYDNKLSKAGNIKLSQLGGRGRKTKQGGGNLNKIMEQRGNLIERNLRVGKKDKIILNPFSDVKSVFLSSRSII